jgi:hypothetical protein
MAGLITLDTAKLHLRITDADHDADVQLKADQASAIVMDYIVSGRKRWAEPVPPWTSATVDPIAQTVMLELLTLLYEHRGDDFGVDLPGAEFWHEAERKLARLRSPALA